MNRNVIPQKNCIYIGPDQGVDPLTQAVTAAVSGDTIIVLPGSYTVAEGSQLFKNGVNWHFMPGASVTKNIDIYSSIHSPYGIFDDRVSGAVTCKITGHGQFHLNADQTDSDLEEVNPILRGLLVITDDESDVHFEARQLSVSVYNLPADYSVGNAAAVSIWDASNVVLKIDRIIDPNYSVSNSLTVPSSAVGLVWKWGETTADIGLIKTNSYGIICDQKSGASGSSALTANIGKVQQYETHNCIAINNGTLSGWRTLFTIGTLYGDTNSNDIVAILGGGTHSIRAKFVYSPTSSVGGISINSTSSYNPTVVVNYEHVETPEYALIVGANGLGSPTVTAEIDYVAQSSTGRVAYFGAGESTVIGGTWISGNNEGVQHAGGVTRLRGLTIKSNSTNGANNHCINVTSAGLILSNCTLIAPALADSIYAAASRTVKVYGTTYANKAKNANITIQAGLGTLVADSNVT